MKLFALIFVLLVFLTGCGIENAIRKSDDRYAQPGAMDPVLTEIFYKTFEFKLLDRYSISHHWVNTSACSYRAAMKHSSTPKERTFVYIGQDVVEQDNKSWQRFSNGKLIDFDPYVRSVTLISKEKGREGQPYEAGLKTMCFEYWWTSSHFLSLRLHKRSVAEFEAIHTERAPVGRWQSVKRNGMQWRVQQVPLDQLRPPPRNGLGGPHQVWLAALGDTGYTMAFEMGASTESLKYPQAHAALEKVYMHLIDSLKVERLQP